MKPHDRIVFNSARGRGVAMLLVMLALAIGTILAVSFMTASSTSVAIASNVNRHAQARAIAESGLDITAQYLRDHDDWRTTQPQGIWTSDQDFDGGTFTVQGTEEDGDFTDDPTDLVDIAVTGYFEGVSHILHAQVTGQGKEASNFLLLITGSNTISAQDQVRVDWATDWGWSVRTLADNASNADYQLALLDAQVIWVSQEASPASVGTRLTDVTVGVINEAPGLLDNLLISNAGTGYTHTQINVTNNTHFITSHLSLGPVVLSRSSNNYSAVGSNLTSHADILATRVGSSSAALITLEAYALRNDGSSGAGHDQGHSDEDHDDEDHDHDKGHGHKKGHGHNENHPATTGSPAPGRRVVLPWGGNDFDINLLNDDAKELMRKALVWASHSPKVPVPLAYWKLDEASGTTAVETIAGRDGTYIASPSLGGDGVFDTSSQFDEDTDRVVLPADLFDGLTDCTISYWIQTTKKGNQCPFSGAKTNSNNNAHLHWLPSSTRFQLHEAMRIVAQWTMPDIADGYWHQLTLTRDKTNRKYTLYRDGKSMGTVRRSMGAIDVASIVLGEEQDTVGGGFASSQAFVGSMDDVRLFGRVLTPTEVKSLFDEAGYDPSAKVPQQVVSYAFAQPSPIVPVLAAHWALDEQPGGATGWLPVKDRIHLKNKAIMDGYNPELGAYGPTNNSAGMLLSTDSTHNGAVTLSNTSRLDGDVQIGPSTYFPHVVSVASGAQLTGEITSMAERVSLAAATLPSGLTNSSSNIQYDDQVLTLSTNLAAKSLKLKGNTAITVNGDVIVNVSHDFKMQDDAQFIVPQGSSLTLYVGRKMELKNNAKLHGDSAHPDRVAVYLYGSSSDMAMKNKASISGRILINRDLTMKNNATLYGAVAVRDDITIQNDAAIHIASNLPGFAPTLAVDDMQRADGKYRGDAHPGALGQSNTAAQFDGQGDYIEIKHDGVFVADHGTIAFWVNPDTLSGTQGLFSKDANGYGTGGHLNLYAQGGAVHARIQSQAGSYDLSSSGLSVGTWSHVAVVWGGTGFKLYLDGVLVDESDYNGGLGETSGGTGNYEPIVLGADTASSTALSSTPRNHYFKGKMDEVSFFATPLNATQMTALYAGQPIPSAALPMVVDTSGAGHPLDLYIQDTDHVEWLAGGGLRVVDDTSIVSPGDATKVYNALTATGSFTLEAMVSVPNLTQDGPAGIVSMSSGASALNFLVGQSDSHAMARVRTSDTSSNGTPTMDWASSLEQDTAVHLMLAFDGETGQARLFRNGVLDTTIQRSGDLSTWRAAMRLMLANNENKDAPWRGNLYRVVLWDRAFNATQANNVYNGQDPGTGFSGGAFRVTWIEQP